MKRKCKGLSPAGTKKTVRNNKAGVTKACLNPAARRNFLVVRGAIEMRNYYGLA